MLRTLLRDHSRKCISLYNLHGRAFQQHYRTCIRSSLDYACPVFHYALPKYLQIELERVQKRALSCIFPREHYSDTLQLAGPPTIRAHQEVLSKKLFNSIFSDSSNKAHGLLPKPRKSTYALRKQRKFSLPAVKTQRSAKSFIVKSASEAMF